MNIASQGPGRRRLIKKPVRSNQRSSIKLTCGSFRFDREITAPRSEKLAGTPGDTARGVITTDAMNELCTLMKSGELTSGVFDDWVSRYYAMPGNGGPGSVVEPRSVESSRGRVRAFDAFLMRPQTVQCRFIDAIIALRNVFALHAGMSTPATIVLGAEAGPSLGDLLRQLIAVPAERAHA